MTDAGSARTCAGANRPARAALPLCAAAGALSLLGGTWPGVAGAAACAAAGWGLARARRRGPWLAAACALGLGALGVAQGAALLVLAIAPVRPAALEFHLVRLLLLIGVCVAWLVVTMVAAGAEGRGGTCRE